MSVQFETTYNVSMSCEGCVADITKAVDSLAGISSVKCDIPTQTVSISGSAPPSEIVAKIQNTGREAVIRGSGQSGKGAGVCILENFSKSARPVNKGEKVVDLDGISRYVSGLARLIYLTPSSVFLDLTFTPSSFSSTATYSATIRQTGDLSNPPHSLGPVVANLGELNCKEGRCTLFKQFEMGLYDIIGRSIWISSDANGDANADGVCGVIARSAGVWDNDKQVCSCTGKNLWQERTEALGKGIN